MASGSPEKIADDLPMYMTMAAFMGIAWYVGIEINISLFLTFRRRKGGMYFWSCALASWGCLLQPLFILLADFGIWGDGTNLIWGVSLIYLTWMMMVVPQSWVLYSRLHLIMHGHSHDSLLRWIKCVLIFNSVVFSIPTAVLGTIAQTTSINPNLIPINTVWDRLQVIVFFVQETLLSLIYIYQARKYLRDCSVLFRLPQPQKHHHHQRQGGGGEVILGGSPPSPSINSSSSGGGSENINSKRQILRQLLSTNVLIIALDVALLAIQSMDLFYLQGAFKPCVYGVKLKVEFVILNRLVKMVRSRQQQQQQRATTTTTELSSGSGLVAAAAAGVASPQKSSVGAVVMSCSCSSRPPPPMPTTTTIPWRSYPSTTITSTTQTRSSYEGGDDDNDDEMGVIIAPRGGGGGTGGGGRGLRSFKSQDSTEPILR